MHKQPVVWIVAAALLGLLLAGPAIAPARVSAAPAACAPIAVSSSADSGPGSLRQALNDICAGGTLNFTTPFTITLLTQLDIAKDVTIDASTTPTVTLSGAGLTRLIEIQPDSQVTLRGLGLTQGFIKGQGGAIANAGRLTLDRMQLYGSDADGRGGAIANSGELTITHSSLSLNGYYAFNGGAIYNAAGGVVRISHSSLRGNQSINNGGAILSHGFLEIRSSVLAGNHISGGYGGAISSALDLTARLQQPAAPPYAIIIVDSLFENNSAGTGSGGAFGNLGQSVVITRTRFTRNQAVEAAGALLNGAGGQIELFDSTLDNNWADQAAGAIVNYNQGSLVAVRSEIISNTVSSASFGPIGGGIVNEGLLTLANVTLANNRLLAVENAEISGGAAIYQDGLEDTATTLIHTTISANQDDNSPARSGLWFRGGGLTIASSIVAGNGATGLENFAIDPQSVQFVSTGGNLSNSTDGLLTGPGDQQGVDPGLAPLEQFAPNRWTFPLQPAALALDAALAPACSAAPVSGLDQRRVTRPQGPACDSGAYEHALQTDLGVTLLPRWDPVLIGATNYMTLTVANNGPVPASGVVVTTTLPAGTSLMTVSDPACSLTGQLLVCLAGDLPAGGSYSAVLRLRLTAAIPDNTTLVSQAVVTAHQEDPTPANNHAIAPFLAVIELLVYQLDGTPGSEWGENARMAAPACGSPFLGEFSSGTVTLTIPGLQEHYYARTAFDLYILRSWDGNQVDNQLPPNLRPQAPDMLVGPDRWSYAFAGQPMLATTFTNWSYYHYNQAFPGTTAAGSSYPAQTGARAVNSLCYTFMGYDMDAIYPLAGYVTHDGETLQLDFTAAGLQEIEDESWGLGGLAVYIRALPLPQVFLPVVH